MDQAVQRRRPGAPRRTLAEAPQARFISLFVTNPAGGVSSFLVGGKTDEFNAFAAAVAEGRPIEGGSDESFTDLIVFSFGC